MSNKAPKTVRVDADQHKKLSKLRKDTGVPVAESVRRAIQEYIDKKGTPATENLN